MDYTNVLEDAGLSKGEIDVYLALLKFGPTTVNEIKNKTKINRTTIYDFLDKLSNRGLISRITENNVKHYKATNPNKLLDLIKEKEDNIRVVLPDLMKLIETKKEEINVEVYKGKEGLKTSLNDILRTGKDVIGFGIDEMKFKEKFPYLMEQYFKKEEEIGIKERLLASDNTTFIFKNKTADYRFIPEEFFNPTPTLVYGNMVIIVVWEPLTVVMIENPALADSYKKYFELLWRIAKKSPKSKLVTHQI